jgi:hypothetical protein
VRLGELACVEAFFQRHRARERHHIAGPRPDQKARLLEPSDLVVVDGHEVLPGRREAEHREARGERMSVRIEIRDFLIGGQFLWHPPVCRRPLRNGLLRQDDGGRGGVAQGLPQPLILLPRRDEREREVLVGAERTPTGLRVLLRVVQKSPEVARRIVEAVDDTERLDGPVTECPCRVAAPKVERDHHPAAAALLGQHPAEPPRTHLDATVQPAAHPHARVL